MKFTEAKLAQAIIALLGEQGFPYLPGEQIVRASNTEVLIKDELRIFLPLHLFSRKSPSFCEKNHY